MRVAFCLSGEPRDFRYIFDDFSRKTSLDEYKFDLYVHTWVNRDGVKSNLPTHSQRPPDYDAKHVSVIDTASYLNSVSCKAFLAEDYYSSKPYRKSVEINQIANIQRMHSMIYSIQRCAQLTTNENYDVIIRSRPDIYFDNKLDMEYILQRATEDVFLAPNLFINVGGYSGTWTPDGDHVPDFFWVGGRRLIQKMLHIFDDIDQLCGNHQDLSRLSIGDWPSIPENYIMRWLKYNRFQIEKIETKMLLARHHEQFIKHGGIII